MKMIGQQASGQNIGMWKYTFSDFIKKKQVVLAIEKYRLRIVSAIEDMIDLTVAKFHPCFLSSI